VAQTSVCVPSQRPGNRVDDLFGYLETRSRTHFHTLLPTKTTEGAPGSGFWNLGLAFFFPELLRIHHDQRAFDSRNRLRITESAPGSGFWNLGLAFFFPELLRIHHDQKAFDSRNHLRITEGAPGSAFWNLGPVRGYTSISIKGLPFP